MVSAVVIATRISTKSSAKMALTGTSCGSAAVSVASAVSVMSAPSRRTGRLGLAERAGPVVVVRVVTHHIRGEAHVTQNPRDVHRLDLAEQEPFDHRRVVEVVAVLPPDLPATLGAEV